MGRRRRRASLLLLGIPLGLSLLWWLHEGDREIARARSADPAKIAPGLHPRSSHRPNRAAPAVEAPAVAPEDAVEAAEPVQATTGLLRIAAVREDGSPEPDAEILVGPCGDWSVIEDSPAESVIEASEGSCEVNGYRRDGLLTSRAEPVVAEITTGGSASVELVFPSNRTGGIGISFRPTPDGMEVLWVRAGSPAEEAGLQPGDLVTDVDGVDASGLGAGDFVDLMTGPEGTQISFTVAYPGDTGQLADTLELTRAYIPPDRS